MGREDWIGIQGWVDGQWYMGLDGSIDSWDLFSGTGSLICMRGVSECLYFNNLLSECFSSVVPGWLVLREPDTW